jgi:signal transduction histidine kinase
MPVVLLFLLWAQVSAVLASEPQRLAAPPSLEGHLSVLLDPSSALTLADIVDPHRQDDFKMVSGHSLEFGFDSDAIWLRLTLPAAERAEGILSVSPNFLDTVDIYTAGPGKGAHEQDYRMHETGDHRPLPPDHSSGLDNTVRLQFEPGQITTVYIRVLNSHSFTRISLGLQTMEAHARQAAITGAAYGLWFGGMSALFLIHIIFFYFGRRAQYVWVALNTFSVMLVCLGNWGISHILLFQGNGVANDLFLGLNAWMGLTISALACGSVLSLRRKSAALSRLYLLFAWIGLVGIGFTLAGRSDLFGPFGHVASLLGATLNCCLALRYMNENGTASRLRAAAFCSLSIGSIITLAPRLGYNVSPDWGYHAYSIAVLVETILLTGSLAVWLRQAEALSQTQVMERRRAEDALQAEMQSQLQQVQFLEVVSHQYRTSLAAIRSSADGIAISLPAGDGANLNRVSRVRRAVARLVEILEVNLSRSRMQGPSFRPDPAVISAASVVARAHQRGRDLLAGADISLDIETDVLETRILADSAMLELAILNLLENAVKYTLPGTGASIALSMRGAGAHIMISVSDRGIGIPEADLPHLFDHAVRGSNTGGTEGTGLGLFLVAKVAKTHGGSVEIFNRDGGGSTVRINLPLQAG